VFALRWWHTPRVAESTRPWGHCRSTCSSRGATAAGTPQRRCSGRQRGAAHRPCARAGATPTLRTAGL